jgi:hypothetical protein
MNPGNADAAVTSLRGQLGADKHLQEQFEVTARSLTYRYNDTCLQVILRYPRRRCGLCMQPFSQLWYTTIE